MQDYALYNGTTGQITCFGTMDPGSVAVQTDPIYLGLVDPKTQYIKVSDGTLIARPALPGTFNKTSISANGIDTCTISGLPNPAYLILSVPPNKGISSPTSVTSTDGTFTFATRVPGTYTITVDGFPYVAQTFTITAS